MKTTTQKITAVMGIMLDLRGTHPGVAASFSALARTYNIAPLEEPFRCPVVVMGDDDHWYDATALGEAALHTLDR